MLLLAVVFAYIQNPVETSDPTKSRAHIEAPESAESIEPDSQHIKAGQQVFEQQGCARCHSIAGKGNSGNPLDGVGVRRTAEEIRDWIIAADGLQGILPARVFKLKQSYAKLPDHDLEVLVIYMQSLRL